MARGSSYGNKPGEPSPTTTTTNIPRRATRNIANTPVQEKEPATAPSRPVKTTRQISAPPSLPATAPTRPVKTIRQISATPSAPNTPHVYTSHPLVHHRPWLRPLLVSLGVVIIGLLVLGSVDVALRPSGVPQVIPFVGQSYQVVSVQLGGTLQAYNTWEHSNGPIASQTALPSHPGPYSVLGKPTISADFINQVLAAYNSPTAGMGQSLYDLGVKYGIDPVYPLAFFMHESLFGTTGEARATLSLGNERCIPDRACIDQDRGGYAQMKSWQDGFEQWYKLIRNLYVAQWGRVTVDQIIPKYAPNSDGNDEAEYIATLKHEIDTWHAGILKP